MRLLVIDGNSIANRAFYGIKLLTTKDGRYTNAIYGFLNILLSLLKECQPDEVAVAFDLKAPTFRHKMYDGYKATRHAMPEELAQQMPVLKQLLADLGYRTVTAEGWEADDILGTLAAACAARKDDCFLATGDRDSLQLVSESTTVLLAATVMGRSKTVVMDEDAIQEKYGLAPKQLIEVKSLMGDTSDNIPGVKGIGEKTALSLVQTFGSLEGVYENIDDKRIKPKQREHLLEDKPMAELSHTLGTIRTDAPIDTAEGSYTVGEGNKPAAVRLLQELEIHSLIPRFGLDGVAPEAAAEEEAVELPEADLAPLPLTPAGHYLVAARPAVTGKQGTRNVVLQPESWYAVQDTTVYPLEDADLVRLLDNADVTLDVFNSAPLYAKAMAAGGWGSSIVWDGKLAAYLLDASASRLHCQEVIAAQGVILAESLANCGIPVRVSAFSSLRGYTVLRVLKGFADKNRQNIFRYFASGWNRDGLALRAAGDLIQYAPGPAPRHLMILLTDASPNDSRRIPPTAENPLGCAYEDAAGVTDTAAQVRTLQRQGVRVSAVFMGEDSSAGAAAQIYGKNMARIRGMDQLARAAGRLIQNEIRELGD